ncbi:MAG: hypothetical protein JXR96_03395 [Deltaproteobacteria bacterium]|nr:hypothetical protein [Deltaproteobacteria bacterium]
MLLRIFAVIASILCIFVFACSEGGSSETGPTAEPAKAAPAKAAPAPAEPAPAPEPKAAGSADWKERFQKSLDAIEASPDPWATMCEQLDAMCKAKADGDPEVRRVLNFDEQWVRLGAKLGRNKGFCDRNEKAVFPAGSDVVKDLKNPWEAVKAKLP